MSRFATRAQVKPSATMAINSLALQKKQQGESLYNFAGGDPAVVNHEAIVEAMRRGHKEHLSPYPPVAGIAALRSAAAEWMNRHYQTHFQQEHTLVTCGGKFAIFSLAQALLQEGDEAVILAPYWVSYPGIVSLAGAKARIIPTEEKSGWKVTAGALAKHLTKKTKMLIFNNGCNPTGALYTRGEIAEILAVCQEADITVLSDEVYSEIVYGDNAYVSCGSFPDHKERVVVVQSCSKNFAMAGWRVGFAFGPVEVIKVLTTLQGQSTTGTSIVSQWAALGAVQHADVVAKEVRDIMEKRRELFCATYEDLFDVSVTKPASAIYIFSPISHFRSSEDSVEFCRNLLDKSNVALVPGVAFGTEGYVRFSFSCKEQEIINGLKALSDHTGQN